MQTLHSWLTPSRYEVLRIAAQHQAQPNHQTLGPSALLSEIWLRISKVPRSHWSDNEHLFAYAVAAAKSAKADHVRRRSCRKRGEGVRSAPLSVASGVAARAGGPPIISLDVKDALRRLHLISPQHGRIASRRLYLGLTVDETAVLMKVSRNKVKAAAAALRETLGPSYQQPDPS